MLKFSVEGNNEDVGQMSFQINKLLTCSSYSLQSSILSKKITTKHLNGYVLIPSPMA